MKKSKVKAKRKSILQGKKIFHFKYDNKGRPH